MLAIFEIMFGGLHFDLWQNKSSPDGWAGGRTGPDQPDEMLSISFSKAGEMLAILKITDNVVNTKWNTQNR